MNKQTDHIIRRGEPTVEYTVRSGHKLILQEGHTNTHSNYKHFYKRIWSLDLPPKIKITNWRLFRNFLPIFCNLHYRILMGSAICRRCHNGPESSEHVFKECPTMRVLISRWDAPTDPWVKINFDAAFKKELKESCSGLVARNARSEVIFSKTVFHKNIPSTFAAEAMACL